MKNNIFLFLLHEFEYQIFFFVFISQEVLLVILLEEMEGVLVSLTQLVGTVHNRLSLTQFANALYKQLHNW